MSAILGLGVTHYPPLCGRDEDMARILKRVIQDPDLRERYRRPDGWRAAMREEYGADEGLGAARRHRAALIEGFRETRRRLDDFGPDLVLIWGDDQYENFKEDIIPPFCVLAYESIEHRPWAEARWKKSGNAWDEASDATFVYKGHRAAAKSLVSGLLDRGFDVSYAYRPLHHPLGHAFMNTLLYLDYDRQGFPYPVVPFSINCYGRRVISQYGGAATFADLPTEAQLDPPSPAPLRCFEFGQAAPARRPGRGYKMTVPPLAGLRVIDAASFIAGPVATTILADLGADVVKIEPPDGDTYRHRGGGPGVPESPYNYRWIVDNRTKRGLALDLRKTEGCEGLCRLVERADVFVTNTPLDSRARLGIRWEDLAPLNSRLIYASVTAYGERGEEAPRTGFDATALWARTGLMDLVRAAPDAPPPRSLPAMGDHPTGASLSAAIITALYQP